MYTREQAIKRIAVYLAHADNHAWVEMKKASSTARRIQTTYRRRAEAVINMVGDMVAPTRLTFRETPRQRA